MTIATYIPPTDRIPKRLAILIALQAQLETMDANSPEYCFTVVDFLRNKTLIGAQVKYPAIAIIEAPAPDLAAIYVGNEWGGDAMKESWTLLIQGMAQNDSDGNNTDSAYYFAADTVRCLSRITALDGRGRPAFPQEHMLGGKITDLQIAPPVVRGPEKSVSATATFFLALRVGVAGLLGDPYTSLV